MEELSGEVAASRTASGIPLKDPDSIKLFVGQVFIYIQGKHLIAVIAISQNLLFTMKYCEICYLPKNIAKFAVYHKNCKKVASPQQIANLSYFMINLDSYPFSQFMYNF